MDETPFTNAQKAINEACGWLSALRLPVDDPRRENCSNEDIWEQVRDFLTKADSALVDAGFERVEDGGQEVEGYGWLPAFRDEEIDPATASAARAFREIAAPLYAASEPVPVEFVTEQLIEQLRSLLPGQYSGCLENEAALIASQPDEPSWA